MNAQALPFPPVPVATVPTSTGPSPLRRFLAILAIETRCEILKAARLPAYALPTIAFPIVFYAFFGLAFGRNSAGPVGMSTYLLGTYGAFGVIGAALFSLGVGVATERGQGWMLLRRATPLPPLANFLARTAVAGVFGTAIVSLLFACGALFGGVALPAATWAALGSTLVAGVLPFTAMGLALGFFAGPNSAAPLVNLIYLPLSFLSGLWVPVQMLPDAVQGLAVWLPPYHYAQLALRQIGAAADTPWTTSVAYLGVFTVVALGVAVLGYRRDSGKTYG